MTDIDVRQPNGAGGPRRLLTSDIGRVLSTPTLSRPRWSPSTPRWILRCFTSCDGNVPVRGGVFQVNRVRDDGFRGVLDETADALRVPSTSLAASFSIGEGETVDTSLAIYDPDPPQIHLEVIRAVINMPTHVPQIYSDTHDQLQSQLSVTGEFIYETIEHLVFNHPVYGLLETVDGSMEFEADAPPSPDVLDDLLALAWKRPDCFLMHPIALARFHKEATTRGVVLESVELFGQPFTTWRGLPICPTNKLHVITRGSSESDKGGGEEATVTPRSPSTTNILLVRVGQEKQGVVNLYAADVESDPGLPFIGVEFMGRSDDAVVSYLLTTYSAVAVLSPGALARAKVTL